MAKSKLNMLQKGTVSVLLIILGVYFIKFLLLVTEMAISKFNIQNELILYASLMGGIVLILLVLGVKFKNIRKRLIGV